MRCKICAQPTASFAQAMVLKKYKVQYFRCPGCGFVQTEEPHWLDEAYSKAIVDIDIGPVNRSYTMAEKCRTLLLTLFNPNARYVDYGAGYGILVRRMRDLGFDFHHYDTYAENIFARGFTAEPTGSYELLTAFEVFEHLREPRADLVSMLRFAPNIFFATDLIPPHQPGPETWWYYVLDFGQHIALYSRRSLELLAIEHGLYLYSDGISTHLMTRKRIPEALFRLLMKRRLAPFVYAALGRRQRVRSLLPEDFARVSGYYHKA